MYLDSSNFDFVEREFPEKTTEVKEEEFINVGEDVIADTAART